MEKIDGLISQPNTGKLDGATPVASLNGDKKRHFLKFIRARTLLGRLDLVITLEYYSPNSSSNMKHERQEETKSLLNRHVNWNEVFNALNLGVSSAALISILESTGNGQINVAAGKSIITLAILTPGAIQYISEDIADKKKRRT